MQQPAQEIDRNHRNFYNALPSTTDENNQNEQHFHQEKSYFPDLHRGEVPSNICGFSNFYMSEEGGESTHFKTQECRNNNRHQGRPPDEPPENIYGTSHTVNQEQLYEQKKGIYQPLNQIVDRLDRVQSRQIMPCIGKSGMIIPVGYYEALDGDGEYHFYPILEEEQGMQKNFNEKVKIALQVLFFNHECTENVK